MDSTTHTYTGHTLFTATCSCGASLYNGGSAYLTARAARALHATHAAHPYRPTRVPATRVAHPATWGNALRAGA